MTKFLLAILLFLSTVTVVAHGILVYQLSATESLITEEESSDSHAVSTDGKDFSKEQIHSLFGFYRYGQLNTLHLSATDNFFTYPKGFSNKPYNPPEAV
jgi:hypothetical protein